MQKSAFFIDKFILEGEFMANQQFEERKEKVYHFMSGEFYVPMKEKELAIMLQVSKEDR